MKAILFEDEIITLENFFSATIYDPGTGTKSNPHHYSIRVRYTDVDRYNSLEFGGDEKSAKEWLNKIFEVLTKEEG